MKKSPLRFIPAIILTILLVFLLVWRWRVSVTRFFDIDEFTYLHWAAQVARGEQPYIDFFSYFTPGFLWAMAPIFWIVGKSTAVFTAGRVVSFGIFLGILGSLGYLFGITRARRWVLLPIVILAFLPLPYEKLLEVRPDNLATLLALIGVIGEVRGIREKKNSWWFFSGLAYSASLFVLVKTLPFVLVGGLIALLSSRKKFPLFILGLLGPWALYFLNWGILGHFPDVWYALVRLPFEVSRSAVFFPMEANLFFYPNWWFYGGDGVHINAALIVNHLIWMGAVLVGVYRLLSSFTHGSKEKGFVELLFGCIFFLTIVGYVKFFPLKHVQYLIPISVFIAYYAADGLSALFTWLEGRRRYEIVFIILFSITYVFITITRDINTRKLTNTYAGQMSELVRMMQTIPLSARVVDLEGRMLFFQSAYPVCCLPFDVFLPYVSHGPPSLARYLSKSPADYIYDGETHRIITMSPEDLSYIHQHYAPVSGFDERLWKKK